MGEKKRAPQQPTPQTVNGVMCDVGIGLSDFNNLKKKEMLEVVHIFIIFIVTGLLERKLNEICKAHPKWIINTPVHKRWFGENKTFRGFVNHTSTNVFVTWIYFLTGWSNTMIVDDIVWIGAGGGFIWCLGELPNSFMKRRLGIQPGQQQQQRPALYDLQFLIDHLDSSLALIVYLVFVLGYPTAIFWFLPLAMILHMIHRISMDFFYGHP